MAPKWPPLLLLLALGMWAVPNHGETTQDPTDPPLRLRGGPCRCAGLLEVLWAGEWEGVCRDAATLRGTDAICQLLACGPITSVSPRVPPGAGTEPREPRGNAAGSRETAPNPSPWGAAASSAPHLGHHPPEGRATPTSPCFRCFRAGDNPPETPSLPPTTPPEPPGPPRLRLVDGESGCSGSLELYREGVWGAVASGVPPELATRLCQALGCGSAIRDHWKPGPGSHLPVRWEAVEPCGSRPLLTCFNRTGTRTGRAPAAISCSGSSPRALRRLWGGPTPCEGDLEVFAGGQWQVLCDTGTRRAAWGQELCQELRCGNLSSSTEIRDPPATGVTCGVPTLRLCPPHLGDTRSCSRTRVVCQASKPQPPGTGAGTILSICLGLLLAALLLLAAPPACRSLLRRVSQKKQQRQWIGPTGLNQMVSFHRPSTATSRPRVPGGDNDYSQAPQKTSPPPSASPGTTGAPNPPDNSSDSDYDLSSAHRL